MNGFPRTALDTGDAGWKLGELLFPSPEGRRLLEQARAAANELGMPGLTKPAIAAYE